jgi:queuine tRNA-ribosyltransferase
MFTLRKTKGKARRGVLETRHGFVQTPIFMPIATRAAVKTLSSEDVAGLGAQIILSNTYHLLLRPGRDAMRSLGGLHSFMRWDKPILTDSGGYQVFSLANVNAINEEGVRFQSHIDGSRLMLTPEGSMAMQAAIGSDIVMQFDDVAAAGSSRERVEEAMDRSLRWAGRCKESVQEGQQLFGIVQGGVFEDLRERSARALVELDLPGYAIGGLSVGEPRESAFRITKQVCDILPTDKPRYFMGGGMPEEIVYYVTVGVDMFDCVLPTRNARHGTIFVWAGDPKQVVREAFTRAQEGASDERIAEVLYRTLSITKEPYTLDTTPLDPFSDCPTSHQYTKAYVRHLFRTEEMLGARLATLQNVRFYLRLMEELRLLIEEV